MYVIMSVCYIYLHIIYPGDDGTAKHQLIFSGEGKLHFTIIVNMIVYIC